jgi:hypothetical protein
MLPVHRPVHLSENKELTMSFLSFFILFDSTTPPTPPPAYFSFSESSSPPAALPPLSPPPPSAPSDTTSALTLLSSSVDSPPALAFFPLFFFDFDDDDSLPNEGVLVIGGGLGVVTDITTGCVERGESGGLWDAVEREGEAEAEVKWGKGAVTASCASNQAVLRS